MIDEFVNWLQTPKVKRWWKSIGSRFFKTIYWLLVFFVIFYFWGNDSGENLWRAATVIFIAVALYESRNDSGSSIGPQSSEKEKKDWRSWKTYKNIVIHGLLGLCLTAVFIFVIFGILLFLNYFSPGQLAESIKQMYSK